MNTVKIKSKRQHKRFFKLKITIAVIVSVIIILFGAFLLYASVYYKADDVVISAMSSDDNIDFRENMIVLSPSVEKDTTIIFYPGAKVEYTAYLPLMEKIQRECNVRVVLVKMPFNMAIFNAGVADEIMEEFPETKNFYIAGHSMGGAMASDYASKNPDKIKGLILMGAYIYGDYPPEKTLTIYGSFNDNLEKDIDYTENIVKIEGGNHAQFGNYGKQKGDPDATITADEQQNITVNAIKDFLNR